MSRSAPKVILPALDAPRSRNFGAVLRGRPGNRLQREQSEIPQDPLTRALLPAIRDMQIIVGHVYALLDGPVAQEAGIIEWLKHLQAELDISHEAVISGRMAAREVVTMDDEEPAGLDDALSRAWDSEANDWPDQAEFHLLARLTGYWIQQVRDRGYALVHLMIGADDLIEAADSLQKLGEVRYPL